MRSTVVVALALAAGCEGPDRTGEPGQACFADRTCLPGFECNREGSCVPRPLDAGPDAVRIDAAFCPTTDEPNDTPAAAKAIVTLPATITDLGICTNVDEDFYKLTTTQMSTIEARTTITSGSPVAIYILGAAGTTLATGTADSATSMVVSLANAPAGEYFVEMNGRATSLYMLGVAVIAQ